MIKFLGLGLILLGIIGTIFCYFTKSFESFGGVWNKCIGIGAFLAIIGGLLF